MKEISKAAYEAAVMAGQPTATEFYVTDDPNEEPHYGTDDGKFYLLIPLTQGQIHLLSLTAATQPPK